MLSQIAGVQGYNDSATSLSRSTAPQSGLPIIYGGASPDLIGIGQGCSIKTGSIVNWFNVLNDSSQYLFTSHAIAMGEVGNVISQIYFDDEPVLAVPITTEGVVPNSSINSKYAPYLQLEVYFGKSSYTQPKVLAAKYAGDRWNNSTFHGSDIVQIYTVIKKTQDSLEDSILTNDNYVLTVETKGLLIRDLVDMQIRTSSNGPSQLYDYIVNPEYGMGINPNLLDLASFRTAAQYCNSFEYYSNGAIDYSASYKSNMELILQTFGGIMYIHAGKVYLTVDIQSASVASFDESTIFGDFKVTTSGSSSYFNVIDATWTHVSNSFSQDVLRIPSDISQDDVVKGDGKIVSITRDYSWVYDKEQVASLVNTELLKSKYSQSTISFNTDSGWDLKVWDVITVSFAELWISNKQYRVISKSLTTSQEDIGMINVQAVEYFPAAYQGVDPGVWSADGSISSVINVIPPSNLQVVKKGGTVGTGSVVSMTWTGSTDAYLRGYNVYYRVSGQSAWTFANSTSAYVTNYDLFNLDETLSYDFAIAAYNNLGLMSQKVTITGLIPKYEFSLPAVTNLHLVNGDISDTSTNATDFIFSWDLQTTLRVNGLEWSQYFTRYEIAIYNASGVKVKSYYTQDNNFTYTFAMNQADKVGRSVKIGVIAWGATSGTYSPEVQLSVTNPQAPLLDDLKLYSGIGLIQFTWGDSNRPDDYAGILIQISSTENFAAGVQNFTTDKAYTEVIAVPDGQYWIRAGQYDKFGMDGILFTAITPFLQQTSVPFSQLNNDVVDGILSSSEFNTVKQQIIDEAGYSGWNVSVNNNGYVTGIALGNDGAESVFTVVADRFSMISSASAAESTKVYPFVVQNGTTYLTNAMIQNAAIGTAQIADLAVSTAKIADASINTAKIQDASITNAKIGATIQSSNYVANSTGWQINKSGTFYINGSGSSGRLVINNNQILVYDANGVLRVRMGLW